MPYPRDNSGVVGLQKVEKGGFVIFFKTTQIGLVGSAGNERKEVSLKL